MSVESAPSVATAAFSDVFQVAGHELNPDEPEMIERVRLVLAARPGMLRKLLPIRVDAHGVTSGGVYLFDTYENAVAYGEWVLANFRLDGMLFYDLPVFMEPSYQAWQLVGAEDFASVRTHHDVVRFERWHTLAPHDVAALRDRHWQRLRERALDAGLASVWLLYSPDPCHPQLGLVTVAGHGDHVPTGRADADLGVLEDLPSFGAGIAQALGATKVFDRTSWVYQVWFPLPAENADYDGASFWPNSPPLPGVAARATT